MSRRRYFSPLATTPPPVAESYTGRLVGMGVVLTVFFALLVGRLWLLQMVRGDELRERAQANRNRKVRTSAPRGIITDCKGRVLVANTTRFSVFLHPEESGGLNAFLRIVDPERLKPRPKPGKPAPKPVVLSAKRQAQLKEQDARTQDYLDRLAKLIEVPRATLDEAIKKNSNGPNDPISIRDAIDQRLMARLYELQDDLPGVSVEVVPVRFYPFPNRATHLLGYTSSVSAEELDSEQLKAYPPEKKYQGGDWIGKLGLEKQYDLYLRGTLGYEAFEIDGKGRRRKETGKEPAKAGATLVLALDARVQEEAEKALAGRPGAIVALDPRDGRILAMASAPTYDLSVWTRTRTKADVEAMQKGRAELNRAMSKYPPGSTFKIITMTAGLASHRLPSGAYCPGYVMIGKIKKKCMGTHGGIDPISAFAQSCNVFFFQAGWKIGDEILADWAHKFGLGSKSGIDLPNEKQGTVPSKVWAREERDRGWWRGDLADMAIGQGFDEATPLQMALVASAIGNGGTIWKPHLVDKVVDSDDPKKIILENKPEMMHQLGLTTDTLREVRRAMHAVVERGTSRAAAIPGIDVAGKSGTAETGVRGKAHGWFTCYAARPGEAPSIAVCVLLEATKPGDNFHGGGVCAPLARHVIETYLSKDAPPKPLAKPSEPPASRQQRRRR